MKTIIFDGIEFETETHHFNKKLSDIKIPKGWRLWKSSECYDLWINDELRKRFNLNNCWFYVQQPIEKYKNKYVAWFNAFSFGVDMCCFRDPSVASASLGVRFCRKKI